MKYKMEKIFECQQCGRCCREINIPISYNDIMRWVDTGRKDILFQVSWIHNFPKKNTGGFYFRQTCTPDENGDKGICPFLEDNLCSIQDTKPLACKDAPKGFDRFDMCPAFKKPYPKKIRDRIKRKQRIDYKKAFDRYKELVRILGDMR
ncbi:MAG: YkgJ family cysteine cluster protein [Candidatus Hodarchaeales archaeon]|jgi:Fe-S-cluster containining protein